MVGKKWGRGRGKGEKSEREKGREHRLLPLSPIPLLFSLPPYPLPLSPTYTESGTFADSGRVEQILSKTSSPYKLPGLPPREKIKQHLIRDKFLSKPKAQKVIDNWNRSASWPLNVYPKFQPSPRVANFLDSEPRKKVSLLHVILHFTVFQSCR